MSHQTYAFPARDDVKNAVPSLFRPLARGTMVREGIWPAGKQTPTPERVIELGRTKGRSRNRPCSVQMIRGRPGVRSGASVGCGSKRAMVNGEPAIPRGVVLPESAVAFRNV